MIINIHYLVVQLCLTFSKENIVNIVIPVELFSYIHCCRHRSLLSYFGKKLIFEDFNYR